MTRRPVRIELAEPTTGTKVQLTFTNGERREMDFLPYLHGPIFDEIRSDPSKFREIAVDRELGTVVWPNGADIDPDVLYKGLRPAWSEVEAPA